MESLLLELAGGGSTALPPPTATSSSSVGGGEDAEARAMKEAWEKVFADALAETEGGSAPPPAASTPSSSKPRAGSTSGGKPEDFQKTIRETMERLKQSSAESSKVRPELDRTRVVSSTRSLFSRRRKLTPSRLSPSFLSLGSGFKQASAVPDDPLAALLASLGDLGGDGGDGEGVLESMMDGLMSKEVLYDPLKELHSKVRSTKLQPYYFHLSFFDRGKSASEAHFLGFFRFPVPSLPALPRSSGSRSSPTPRLQGSGSTRKGYRDAVRSTGLQG